MNIDTNEELSKFVISGDTAALLSNRRLIFSLKRLKYAVENDTLTVPFDEPTKVKTLQELQGLMDKFGYDTNLSSDSREAVASYAREQDNFAEFTKKAKDIRDDNFKDEPDLLNDFDNFQSVLGEKLNRKLYDLQLLSAFHMAFSQNACNFAVPGAGKTTIVYGAYAYLKNLPDDDPKHVDKLLVIGPLSSFAPWEKEYEKCFGVRPDSQRLSGDVRITNDDKLQHLYSGSPAELTLIFTGSVSSLRNEIIDFLKRNKTMVVVDEAHRIKNPDGLWGRSSVEIAKEAKSRVVLTGTPAPNGYEDLFNLYQFLYPFKYKDILGFHFGNLVDMSKNSDEDSDRVKTFIRNISPYFIRIKKQDLNLPPSHDHIVVCEMDKDQREIYDYIESKYVKDFQRNGDADVKDVLNKARLIRLRQAASNPALLEKPIRETLSTEDYDARLTAMAWEDEFGPAGTNSSSPSKNKHSFTLPEEYPSDSEIAHKIKTYSAKNVPQKFLATADLILNEIQPNNAKVLIWTIFIQNAKELQSYLNSIGIRAELLIGEVNQPSREQLIDKFNNPQNDDFRVLIANPFSVAESISLHNGCHNAIYLERDYNCANFLQSKDRIHRVGLPANQETNYYYIITKNSIDGVIENALNAKVLRMQKIIDSDIPLFARLKDDDETDLVKALLKDYARRS